MDKSTPKKCKCGRFLNKNGKHRGQCRKRTKRSSSGATYRAGSGRNSLGQGLYSGRDYGQPAKEEDPLVKEWIAVSQYVDPVTFTFCTEFEVNIIGFQAVYEKIQHAKNPDYQKYITSLGTALERAGYKEKTINDSKNY